MIVRASKIVLEVLGALRAGLAVIVCFIAYRLAYEGPIHLSVLKAYVEEALNRPGADFKFVIEDTVLAWAGWERTLDIRGVGVSIQDASGQELASVPEIGFGLSGAALFRGLVAPSRIDLFRPELVLELLAAPDPGKQTGYLTEASIYAGTVSIDDRHAGNVWKAEDLEVHLARGDRGVAGSFRASVPQFGDPARISGDVLLPWNGEQFEIDIKLQRFSASSIGLIETGLSILANADIFLEGQAQTTISRTGELGVTH